MNVNGLAAEILRVLGAAESDVPSMNWLRDVYAVRNCLVHRGGVVDPVSAPNGRLTATWRRMVMRVDDTIIECLPFDVEKGGVVSIGFIDAEHEWQVGASIDLNQQDCADVSHSLTAFVQQITTVANSRMAFLFGVSTVQGPPSGTPATELTA